jgi:hypothetical protein
MSPPRTCRIRLDARATAVRCRQPVTVGVPLPLGLCRDVSALSLLDQHGEVKPLQARSLEQWTDGSHRWVLLDFQIEEHETGWVDLAFAAAPARSHGAPLTVVGDDAGVTMATGDLSALIGVGAPAPFIDIRKSGAPLLDPARTALVVTSRGATYRAVIDGFDVDDRGPLRAAVRLRGRVPAIGLELACRIEMFAGLPAARVRITLHNPRAAMHPGGFWELGDSGSVPIDRAALVIGMAGGAHPAEIRCAPLRGVEPQRFDAPFRLHQESSGRPNWRSPVHVSATGAIPLRYAGYRLTAGGQQLEGGQASPIVEVASGSCRLAVVSRLFWEVFPKAYAVEADGSLHVELLPEVAEPHELQGGERFSHELVLAFGEGAAAAVEWVGDPVTPIIDTGWYEAVGEVPYLSAPRDPDAPYERLVTTAIDGDHSFEAKRDWIDEYGWRHYGDLYADHEHGPAADRPLIVSHYNNQYDGIAGMLTQFMRSGDPRWWPLARDLASHVAHIDIYWTDADKSAYNGGLFWHTFHYVDAGRSSHRSYPRAEGVPGGGPSIEHNYSTGLRLHYLMTGDPDSREAVLRLARWTKEMDEGELTVFRHLSRRPTGLASATGAEGYHGPGRGPANAVHTLLNALRLTGDRAWLDKAEELIRRCVHPNDNLERRNLLDAERRWYYTVFLQALGRYLAAKTERGDEDAMWHYARSSLLHYARWMVAHEYPYLQKPEILDYPTETWAAQDMRKCEVFDLAAKYAEETTERARFIERARYFFEQSVGTLLTWSTRTFTRPVVLMLSYGYAHLWHEAHRDTMALLPPSPRETGPPATFEPQKAIAIRRAKMIVVGAALMGLAGLVALFG